MLFETEEFILSDMSYVTENGDYMLCAQSVRDHFGRAPERVKFQVYAKDVPGSVLVTRTSMFSLNHRNTGLGLDQYVDRIPVGTTVHVVMVIVNP